MGRPAPTITDLHREPLVVASALLSWQRGDTAEAIVETLSLSARTVFRRVYTAWIWTGDAEEGVTGWVLPVPASDTERFAPPGSMNVLIRCLRAAHACGADPRSIRLLDWDGFTALALPGAEPGLARLALAEAHPAPGRSATAALPEGLPVDGPPLDLTASPQDGRPGLVAAAHVMRAHPVPIALALLEQGWSLEEEAYPDDILDVLRHRGLEGPLSGQDASLVIADDPCPRRRHARRTLRRLLHTGKIGSGYHTEFAHLTRGAAPQDRADAAQIGEALIRAGLLGEKPSVGQRHVYLRREALPEIHALIERGETRDPVLAAEWTAPPPAGP